MLTETQLEDAAREYCRLAGEDPECLVAYGPGDMVFRCKPRWKVVAEMIAQHDLVRQSIAFAEKDGNSYTTTL